eukprot:TRINITY_DN18966_c0_g1_i1.p1 TRINITY_DN18966_c0_g1~~TRINITY_DN18966_c0_g1_i1.p1  ORF type:complete len:676 (-),score=113.13 TRINITY_DN18966_c0_g1_i1:101-2128(-)
MARCRGCCRRRSFTLHFESAETELAFLQCRVGRLSFNSGCTFVCVSILHLVTLAMRWDDFMSTESDRGKHVLWMMFVSKVICFIMNVSFAGFLAVLWWKSWLRPAKLEIFCCCAVCLNLMYIPLGRPYYFTKLLFPGEEPFALFIDASGKSILDSNQCASLFLLIDVLITTTHLAFPLRSYVYLPLDILGVLTATVCVVAGTEEDKKLSPTMLVCMPGLVLFAYLGSRTLEIVQRGAFSALLEEKVCRAATEFKLDKYSSKHNRSAKRRPSPEKSSLASTTSSARLFDLSPIQEDGGSDHTLTEQLQGLLHLGEEQHWLLHTDEVQLRKRILGSGSFGVVVEGCFLGTAVAVKIPGGQLYTPKLKEMGNELAILRRLRHPNIVSFHGACVVPSHGQLALVLEMVLGRPLDRLAIDTDLQVADHVQLIPGIGSALQYLHSRTPAIAHRDLKGSNIMVEWNSFDILTPKLLDFGLARVITKKATTGAGTVRYMAPEVLLSQPSTCASDVFSFGRVLYVLLSGSIPFEDLTDTEIRDMAPTLPELIWPLQAEKSPFSAIAQACLEPDPSKRPTIAVIQELILMESGGLDEAANSWPNDWHEAYIRHRCRVRTLKKLAHVQKVQQAKPPPPQTESCSESSGQEAQLFSRLNELIQAVREEGDNGDGLQEKTSTIQKSSL